MIIVCINPSMQETAGLATANNYTKVDNKDSMSKVEMNLDRNLERSHQDDHDSIRHQGMQLYTLNMQMIMPYS
jgi:hypothetical protein